MSAMDYDEIAEILFATRRAAGVTQAEIARQLRVKPSTVGNWEQGTNRVPNKHLPALAKILGYELTLLARNSTTAVSGGRVQALIGGFAAASPELQEAVLRILAIDSHQARRDSA